MDKKFLIVGRSSSGKTSIASAACSELGLKLVKSYTTRPPRNEKESINSKDHIFITEDDVEKYKDDIAAYTEINGYKYFTTMDQIDECDAYVIDPNGINNHFFSGFYPSFIIIKYFSIVMSTCQHPNFTFRIIYRVL